MGPAVSSTLLAIAVSLFSPNVLPQVSVAPAPQVRRAEPPPVTASAAQLEQRADELRDEKAFLESLDYYAAAIKKQPSATLYNKAGISELQLGQYGLAKKDFDRAVHADKTFPEAYNNRAVVFYLEKKFGKAIREYQKALKLRDDSASFHANLGMAYMSHKDYAKMSAEFASALQLDPQVFERRSEGGVAAQLGSPEDHARYDFFIARLYAQAGNRDGSLRYLERAMEDGYKGINEVYKDAEFATLRKDPRFAELMARRPPAIP